MEGHRYETEDVVRGNASAGISSFFKLLHRVAGALKLKSCLPNNSLVSLETSSDLLRYRHEISGVALDLCEWDLCGLNPLQCIPPDSYSFSYS